MPEAKPKITYMTLFADESIHPKFEEALSRFKGELGKSHPMHIGQKEVQAEHEFEHRSPFDTSVVVGRFQVGTKEHARQAVEAADSSFAGWSGADWRERVRVFRKAAELIDQRKFDIAVAITYEVGKNRLEALAECWEAMDAIKLYTGILEENDGYVKKMGTGGPGESGTMNVRPLGAWPVISPFNFPFMLASGMALGALLTGNTVILKPTSEAPLTGLNLYKVYRDAGVPQGAVNYVTGPGGNFEDEFVSNPKVAGIAFTGSRDVGMRLFRRFHSTQPYPKPILLEMGSKNPVIVTAKADLTKAAEGVARAAFGYDGQKCSAASRVYVQPAVAQKFLAALKERTGKVAVGDPRQKGVFMGPVINQAAVTKFQKAVADARAAKGTIVTGGNVLKDGAFSKGFFVEPTVVSGLPLDNRLFREELFLPFVVVGEVATLDEALAQANATDYGLTAGIFSEDPKEIARFMDSIQFGVAYSNRVGGATTGAWPGAQTFVGWKASGATGKGIGGPSYLLTFVREQSRTIVS
jgi:1-pyrroline-5-carboxylate dehydrogenase